MINDGDVYAHIKHNVDTHGFAVLGVADSPVFAYSIGFAPKYGFEIIIIGLPIMIAHQMFHHIYSSLVDGVEIIPGRVYDQWSNWPIKFEECNPANPKLFDWYAAQAEQCLGFKPRILQMILTDRAGAFPDDPSYDREYMDPRQPRLSQPIDGVEDIITKMKG